MAVTKLPKVEELLESGVQFGHETQRWHPKMSQYIYTSKANIHIINVEETLKCLEKAVEVVKERASKGNVIFVGTKKQTSRIIKNAAIKSGSFFVDQRWAGGLLTNVGEIKKSLVKLNTLEKGFEEGVTDRTKYEVMLMKKDWAKLNRLYSGVKTMEELPTAMIVVDAKFEKAPIREARRLNIPVIALVDTNTNPDLVDYVIPGNDDAIKSIELIIGTLANAVVEGNGGKGIEHKLNDYLKAEVEIKKSKEEEIAEDKFVNEGDNLGGNEQSGRKIKKITSKRSTGSSRKGILERVQESKEKEKK